MTWHFRRSALIATRTSASVSTSCDLGLGAALAVGFGFGFETTFGFGACGRLAGIVTLGHDWHRTRSIAFATPMPSTLPPEVPFADRPVLRFAPSPNGRLHLGHAFSALTCFEMARRLGGRFLLRIEDIDLARCRPEHVEGIFRDLEWLGIRWEEPVLRQSGRFARYAAAAARLSDMGLLYPCFATRSRIEAAAPLELVDPDGAPLYPGLDRDLQAAEIERRRGRGEPHVMRIDMSKALQRLAALMPGQPLIFTAFDAGLEIRTVTAEPSRWGDAVIQRKDVPTSYHLSVVVDDAAQGVTHVVRGEDLLAATDLHRLLQVLLGLPAPVFFHHGLIRDAAGRKLSKSLRDTGLDALRGQGLTPNDVRRMAGLA